MNDETAEILTLPDGTPIFMGLVQPPEGELRFGAVPTWSEKNDVLPESQWEEHDDLAPYCETPKAQHFNNCTNASLAWLLKVALRAAGYMDVPDLSLSYQYALNNGGRDAGAMCREVILGAMRGGLPSASLWHEDKIFLPRGGVPQEVKDDAAKHQPAEVYQCMNWADVGSALTRRFTVYHGFVLGSAFINRTPKSGIVPEWDGRRANGHAMGSRGLKKVNGKFRTITPNTWGPSFGDNGVGYVPESYFWAESGRYVNLDCYAIRAVKPTGTEPPAAHK